VALTIGLCSYTQKADVDYKAVPQVVSLRMAWGPLLCSNLGSSSTLLLLPSSWLYFTETARPSAVRRQPTPGKPSLVPPPDFPMWRF